MHVSLQGLQIHIVAPSSYSTALQVYTKSHFQKRIKLLHFHTNQYPLKNASHTQIHAMARLHHLFAATLALFIPLGYSLPHNEPYQPPIPMNKRSAEEVITHLDLIPNPAEKGFFVETFRDEENVPATNRSYSTAIYYLLEGSEGSSVWHRLDAVEVWHYYAGAPLTLSLWAGGDEPVRDVVMGPDVFGGQVPQVAIAKREWQSARSKGDWTLVGTTGEMAPSSVPNYELWFANFIFFSLALCSRSWLRRKWC